MKDSKTDILLEEISESLKELNQNLKEALTSITTELSGIKKKYQICNTLNLLFFSLWHQCKETILFILQIFNVF